MLDCLLTDLYRASCHTILIYGAYQDEPLGPGRGGPYVWDGGPRDLCGAGSVVCPPVQSERCSAPSAALRLLSPLQCTGEHAEVCPD